MTVFARRLQVIEGGNPANTNEPGEARMKIAFATQDLRTVDAHFAGARAFAVYEVGPEQRRFVEAVTFEQTSKQDGVHAEEGEDRITPRVDAIRGCTLLFVQAIGGPAAAKVVNAKIMPMKLSVPEPIETVIDRVQTMLKGTPPPWLRKALLSA